MSVPANQEMSLRPGRFEYKRLAWALVISLAFHALCFGGYEFSRTILPVWLKQVKFLAALAHQLERKPNWPPAPQPTEVTRVFVEVNPAAATVEAPKNAKFYSSQNSKAANTEPDADTDTPTITGQQEHVAKAEDVPRDPFPLRPSAPQKEEQKAKIEQKAEQEKPKPTIGDLAMAKPDPKLRTDTGKDERTRPRTVAEAKLRQPQNNQIPGQKMKQEGGARHRLVSSFDTVASPFGEYDRDFIAAVQQHWDNLLDSQQFALNRTGKVVLQFRLNYDGRITDMHIIETTVGDTLAYVCQLAVTEPAPYVAWPMDMRRLMGDSRQMTFAFFY
jgi:hypothetical protein